MPRERTNPAILENISDKEMNDFMIFIDENNYTADQMRDAYYRLNEVNDETEATPEVTAILNRMRKMVGNDFPLNRFAELIGRRQNYEDAVPKYHKFVDELEISDKEKEVLRSIVDRERNGQVICFVEGRIVGEIKINIKNFNKEYVALSLVGSINELLARVPRGKKYEITFSE